MITAQSEAKGINEVRKIANKLPERRGISTVPNKIPKRRPK
jgi:hypothetical protein